MPDLLPGMGAENTWARRTNSYPGCTCPPWRYNPRHPKPTNPSCPQHGDNYRPVDGVSLAELKELSDVQSA